jgi:hypothetical protein
MEIVSSQLSSAEISYLFIVPWVSKGRGRSAHTPGGRGGKKLMPTVPGRRGKAQFAFAPKPKAPAADASSIFEFDM